MKKSIVKTICITALLFVCFAAGVFGVLSVAAPKVMAEYYSEVGLTNLSLSCNDIYYGKSTDINDQFAMFNQAVSAKNYELTKKYAKKLLNHQHINDFNEYLNESQPNNPYLQNEKNRIVEYYVNALYNTKQVNTSVEYAFSVLEESEVGANFIVAVSGIDKNYEFSTTQKNLILEKYNAMYNYFKLDATGIDKGVAAVRLIELLEVVFRFNSSNTYTENFNEIKSELANW